MSFNFAKKILEQVEKLPDKQILKILLEGYGCQYPKSGRAECSYGFGEGSGAIVFD